MIRAAVAAACLALPTLLLAASSDEAKRHAFEVIERNADQMALLGDSLFYFGELGMQVRSPTSSPTRARSGGSCATPPAPRRRRRTTSWWTSAGAPR
jgi:hypothetical protein